MDSIVSIISSSTSNDNFDISSQLVTPFSLLFTLVSISLSVFEYCLSKHFLNKMAMILECDKHGITDPYSKWSMQI